MEIYPFLKKTSYLVSHICRNRQAFDFTIGVINPFENLYLIRFAVRALNKLSIYKSSLEYHLFQRW